MAMLAQNVYTFLDEASVLYGKLQTENFSISRFQEMVDGAMQSPIEHLFWIACHLQAASAGNEMNPARFVGDGKWVKDRGIHMTPQFPIGKYKADFLLQQIDVAPADMYPPVVVELDGHNFHDKDKRQRSYEKRRDRDIQRAGFKVIHFTGSDVVSDPLRCAFEALEFVACFVGTGRDEYDKTDPLGQGWGE